MANYSRHQDRITGKVIVYAQLKNKSPLLIGRGTGEAYDIEVAVLPGGNPYIPATSMMGCLKNQLASLSTRHGEYFWGSEVRKNTNASQAMKTFQSHIQLEDLVPETDFSDFTSLRDGVRIDPKKGIAEEGKKYEYQFVEPNVKFPFRMEITIREGVSRQDAEEVIGHIYTLLHHDQFRIGAFTNTGFGKLECSDFKAWYFDFPKDAEKWFSYLKTGMPVSAPVTLEKQEEAGPKPAFSIEATFRLKSSLIIGSYGIHGNEPDKSQLKSRDRFVLPGKSIRGAIRHRALKIMKTLGEPDAEDKINDLFGMVDEENEGIKKKGRLRIEESELENVDPMIQNRIRIDRFTGGVIRGALFNSRPVWTTGEDSVTLSFSILHSASPEEKKLLLLVLKDLWLEDLAIGGEKNVGRGVLIGQKAIIRNEGQMLGKLKRKKNTKNLEFVDCSPDDINAIINPQPAEE